MPLIAVTGLVIFLTSTQRLELDAYEATIEFFRRLFLANYDVEFSRISHYVYQYGNEWGIHLLEILIVCYLGAINARVFNLNI